MDSKKIIFFIIVAIIVVLTLIVGIAKYVISPISTSYNITMKENENLSEKVTTLESNLVDVKLIVREELNKKMKGLLVQYIKENTSNLTDDMIKEAAKALTDSAWKHKLPISFVVGVAQATTNFNTTYLVGDYRGIMGTDSKKLLKHTDYPLVYYNDVVNGANYGVKTLSNLAYSGDHLTLSSILDTYISNKTKPDLNLKILGCAAQYDFFVFKKYKQNEDNIVVNKVEDIAGLGG